MMSRSYKLRAIQNGRTSGGDTYVNFAITVPPEIARQVPDGMQFDCTWDETGIHYTPISQREPPARPSWASENGELPAEPVPEEEKPKRARRTKRQREPAEA